MNNNWPTQREVLSGNSIYGNPRGRNGLSSPTWEAANLTYVRAPFTMYFAGQRLTRGCKVHKACAPSLLRVFNRLWELSGKDEEAIDEAGVSKYSGGHNFRLMHGGASLSMHSYGCAIDLDSANNGMYDKTPRFANYPWVLQAFREEGWKWGGDWNGNGSSADERRADGMHWQATR